MKLLGEVLRDTPSGGWEDALYLAFDLEEKTHLCEVFSTAIGFLDPRTWRDRLDESRRILNNRGFSWNLTDMTQIVAEALTGVPKENRQPALAAAKEYLGETGFNAALEKLPASLPHRTDHPWHKIIRDQVGKTPYQKIAAGLGTASPNRVAEKEAVYSKKGEMTQLGLFE